MNVLNAVFLGVVQGLTEFLPVSSSGHLVIMQSLVDGFSQPGVLFDVVLHAGTSLAVVVYFRERIRRIDRSYLILLLVGTVPVVIVGGLFQSFIEVLFGNVGLVGLALLVTAILNALTDRMVARRDKYGKFEAFGIGVAQALAIIPGISRSGATIFAGTSLGVDRKKVAEFSFLLSVPAIAGANVLQIYSHGWDGNVGLGYYAIGFLSAFVAAMVAINVVLRVLIEKKFGVFAIYCAVLGLVVLWSL